MPLRRSAPDRLAVKVCQVSDRPHQAMGLLAQAVRHQQRRGQADHVAQPGLDGFDDQAVVRPHDVQDQERQRDGEEQDDSYDDRLEHVAEECGESDGHQQDEDEDVLELGDE